jgi:hypothetical protein
MRFWGVGSGERACGPEVIAATDGGRSMDLIVKMKFGSHLYGTDTDDSDVDYKGVFLPSVDPNGMRQYQVCGKTLQESSSIGYVLPIISKFYNDYGHRAKLAAENKNIDWKAISHALRAALQTKEILIDGTITYPLKEAPFLLQVKAGQLDYTNEVAPVLESLMDEVERLVNESDLPEKVDIDYWNKFICETLETSRFCPLSI